MVKSAQAVTVEFTTANPYTSVAVNADSLPTGTLYVDGTANAAVVTVSNITTGVYKAAVTLPALTAGQVVGIRIAATVATVAGTQVVWQDVAALDYVAASVWDALLTGITTTGSIGKLLKDDIDAAVSTRMATFTYTTPPTAATIADAVWDEATSGHASAGTTGKALTDILADTSAIGGTGAITWTYTVSESGGTPIADVDVWVTSDSGGSNVLASGRTNSSGVVTFYLDAGTVYVWSQKSGWDFTNPDTEVVS